MARPLRIELAGGLYHVTARGDRREAIYLDEVGRRAWLELVGTVCERFNWRCHAYCQMTNHYHLIVETPDGNLSRGMRHLNGVYTQRFNRLHHHTGHVFQGRYKAILVEKDSYLLELARYVILNPVRAGMVKEPGDWPWSSYRATSGAATAPPWLETHWLLSQFSGQRRSAVRSYVDFVKAGAGGQPVWEQVSGQIFLGSEAFVERARRKLPQDQDLREVPQVQRRPRAKPLSYYAACGDRGLAMTEAYASGGYTMREIADHFGVHYATVSRAVRSKR